MPYVRATLRAVYTTYATAQLFPANWFDFDKSGYWLFVPVLGEMLRVCTGCTLARRPQKAAPRHEMKVQMIHTLPRPFSIVGYEAEIFEIKLLGQFFGYQ